MDSLIKKGVIERIEDLADKKEKEIRQNYYDKYHKFYETAIKVLKRHNVLLYGGTAINELFPKKFKFYEEKELPDIDIFCTDHFSISEDIISTFAKQGYTLTTVKEALHPDTYKIMIEGLQLIDLSVVSQPFFNILRRNSLPTSLGLPTVNIDYIKYSFHIILSEPLNAFRWAKVYLRMVRFYEVFPIDTKCSFNIEKYYLDLPASVEQAIPRSIKKHKLLSFGWDVMSTYINEDETVKMVEKNKFTQAQTEKKHMSPVRYTVINKDSDRIVKDIVKECGLVIDHVFPGDEVLPRYYCLAYNKERCLYVFESANCISYLNHKGKRILSIHSLLHYLYAMYLSTQEKDIHCMIQLLTVLQINNALSDKKLFQQFILNCYGFQKGLITLRKERFLRMKNMWSYNITDAF